MSSRLHHSFFERGVEIVAPDLLGKILVRHFDDGRIQKFIITETEAYRGGDDKACHANNKYKESGALCMVKIKPRTL